jgi:exonuclease VII large subunit
MQRKHITDHYTPVKKEYDQLSLAYTALSKSLAHKTMNAKYINKIAARYQVDPQELMKSTQGTLYQVHLKLKLALANTAREKTIVVETEKQKLQEITEVLEVDRKQFEAQLEREKIQREEELITHLKNLYPEHASNLKLRYIKYLKKEYSMIKQQEQYPMATPGFVVEPRPMLQETSRLVVNKETGVVDKITSTVPFDIGEL